MRISDWSSDVCSADLPDNGRPFHSLFLLLEESYRKCSSSLQQQQPRRPLKIPTVLWKLSSRAVLSPGPFFSFFAPCLSVPSISCSQSSSNRRRLLTRDRKSTRLNSSHYCASCMQSSA